MTKLFLLNNTIKGYINLGLCILLWAAVPVVTKKTLVELDNIQILFYSTIFSVIVMGAILVLKKKQSLIKKYKKKQILNMVFLGFLGNYLYYILLYGAIDKTTASEGFILAYTWPMLVLVLSFIILKEKATARKIVGVLISFVGIIVITTKGNITSLNLTNLYGDAMAIVGALTFALFSVLGKKNNYDRVVAVFIYYLAALIFLIPTVFIFSSFKLPSVNMWGWLMLNGFFVNGVSYMFWFNALDNVKTHMISNLLYLTPFVSLIYIAIFLEEKILASSIIGLVIIVFGVTSQYIKFNNTNRITVNKRRIS